MTQRSRTVSLQDIADAFGVTTEAIRLKRKAGMPTRMESGRPRFDLRDCIAWQREQDKVAAQSATAPDEALERARKLKAEADLKELDLAQKRGELVEQTVLAEALDRVIGGFAATAKGRLGRFEREIVRCQTPGAARKLREAIVDALMEGAREYADQWEAEADELDKAAAEALAA